MIEHSPKDCDFDHDKNGNLIYWDSASRKYLMLEPGCAIDDPNVVIGKVGQQNILPTHFALKPKDLELTQIQDEEGNILHDPILPGVSMFLFFGSNESRQHSLESIAKEHLGRDPHPKNRLYIALGEDIKQAGWKVIYVPLINRNYPIYNPLHVIVVPNSIAAGLSNNATEIEKDLIAKAFVRWNC